MYAQCRRLGVCMPSAGDQVYVCLVQKTSCMYAQFRILGVCMPTAGGQKYICQLQETRYMYAYCRRLGVCMPSAGDQVYVYLVQETGYMYAQCRRLRACMPTAGDQVYVCLCAARLLYVQLSSQATTRYPDTADDHGLVTTRIGLNFLVPVHFKLGMATIACLAQVSLGQTKKKYSVLLHQRLVFKLRKNSGIIGHI